VGVRDREWSGVGFGFGLIETKEKNQRLFYMVMVYGVLLLVFERSSRKENQLLT
jgi:hypothetical protein